MLHLLSSAIALSLLTIPVFAQTTHPPEQTPVVEGETPRRLAISVSVADPSDVKVKDGDRLQVGDPIADRGRGRLRPILAKKYPVWKDRERGVCLERVCVSRRRRLGSKKL